MSDLALACDILFNLIENEKISVHVMADIYCLFIETK